MPPSASSSIRVKASGPGFLSLLALLFIGLKLGGGLAAWSWWWVLAPLWLPPAICVVAALVAMLACLVVGGCVGVAKAIREHGASCPQP